jgi:hypothetical protein
VCSLLATRSLKRESRSHRSTEPYVVFVCVSIYMIFCMYILPTGNKFVSTNCFVVVKGGEGVGRDAELHAVVGSVAKGGDGNLSAADGVGCGGEDHQIILIGVTHFNACVVARCAGAGVRMDTPC